MRDDGGGGGYPFIQHDVWLVWEQFFFKFVYGLAIISYVFRLLRVDGCVSIRNGNGERKIKMEKRNEKNKKYKLKALWICRVIWNGSVSSDEIRIKCIQSRPTSEKWFIPCVRSTICMGSVSTNSPREKKTKTSKRKMANTVGTRTRTMSVGHTEQSYDELIARQRNSTYTSCGFGFFRSQTLKNTEPILG